MLKQFEQQHGRHFLSSGICAVRSLSQLTFLHPRVTPLLLAPAPGGAVLVVAPWSAGWRWDLRLRRPTSARWRQVVGVWGPSGVLRGQAFGYDESLALFAKFAKNTQ
jgi:hypothetical protein